MSYGCEQRGRNLGSQRREEGFLCFDRVSPPAGWFNFPGSSVWLELSVCFWNVLLLCLCSQCLPLFSLCCLGRKTVSVIPVEPEEMPRSVLNFCIFSLARHFRLRKQTCTRHFLLKRKEPKQAPATPGKWKPQSHFLTSLPSPQSLQGVLQMCKNKGGGKWGNNLLGVLNVH